MNEKDLKALELDLLLESIQRRYGYDFRHYAQASLKRRVASMVNLLSLEHISEIIPQILRDDSVCNDFLRVMSITVTEMFRDPDFYALIRTKVVPYLKTYPALKIWHAGCATGEEVYSMAVILKEEGLYQRTQIYATDFNNESLDVAKAGIYPLDRMRLFMDNHNRSGTTSSLTEYYTADDDSARMSDALRENITFANHNLVTDGVFGEMNLILCRNVLIYFDKMLQNRVLNLFRDSLSHRGFLCLGSKESLEFSPVAQEFEAVSRHERIFQKRGLPKASSLAGGRGGD
ncbi:MAG: protein-glutamate O-methyltransferase CheR [Halieaceae bacterium]|jgi:chemotaxis protein methyltransferase CheR|nr:protein-glutamate O-methyltransferase CheR [Halieaceae bacterium]